MSVNPYQTPPPGKSSPSPAAELATPAISLIVASIVAISVVTLFLGFDVFLMASGATDRLPPSGISPKTQIIIRMIWGTVMLVNNIFVLYGAIQMYGRRNYGWSRLSGWLAVIPCLGPCYLLGIPFGIWALVVLNRPGVKDVFER